MKIFAAIWVIFFNQACSAGIPQENDVTELPSSPSTNTASPVIPETTPTVMETPEVKSTDTPIVPTTITTVPVFSVDPDFWMDLPVVPDDISQKVFEIYQRGLFMGNNSNAFSKVGDCLSTNPDYLRDYDLGPNVYNLGVYTSLQPTIEYFSGSFGRPSLAAKKGLSTSGVLAPLWADWKQCGSNETPLDCEFRNHHPSFAIISLGTNEAYDIKIDPTPFEGRLRRIIEHSIDQGVVPILGTKADNDEGNHYINYMIASLAVEYQLPLWNYWRAIQPLPLHGLRNADHLTVAPTKHYADFSNPDFLNYGTQVRNLTALQVLDMVRREILKSGITDAVPTSTPIPATPVPHTAGEKMTAPLDGMPLIYIPAGTFEMGSNSYYPDESPVHSVSLDAFWMDATEVTNAMFTKFLNAVGNQSLGGVPWLDLANPQVMISDQSGSWQPVRSNDNFPVVGVSWFGANAYCQWAGRSLPTEAQWEYAAKGNNGTRFPWGESDLDCDHANYLSCGKKPIDVGFLPLGVSPFGIFDMAGNVAEWVNDRYEPDYYLHSPQLNPTGPINGYYRVYRGGSWEGEYPRLRTTRRGWTGGDTQEGYIGFRCAMAP